MTFTYPSTAVTVAQFDATTGEHPENIALDHQGTIYVTLHRAAKVWKHTRDGASAEIPLPVPTIDTMTCINGIAITPEGTVSVAVRSNAANLAGIWEIDEHETMRKTADLPPDAGVNGMTSDSRGNLYVADDTLGLIWRIAPDAAAVWVADTRLAPHGIAPNGAPVFGANGIKVYRDAVYVSNSSTASIFRIPLLPDGSAGAIETPYPSGVFRGIDDFAFDAAGNLYFATVGEYTVECVAPDGTITVLLAQRDGLDMPSAVAFGVTDTDHTALYVTNAAFYTPPGKTPRASLMRYEVGIAGASSLW